MRTLRTFLLGVAVLPLSWAQTAALADRHQRDLATNPRDVRFRATTGAATRFHRGERIPLILEFSTGTPNRYTLDNGTYDRSGRLHSESFVFDRDDVADPYADYFSLGVITGFLRGGLRSMPPLTAQTSRIELSLNEWFRFDRPGTYRLYVRSQRLSRARTANEPGEGPVYPGAVSNLIELVVLPDDAAWTAAKLRTLAAALEHITPEPAMPPPGVPFPVNPFEDQIRLARRDLRYLATPAAIDLAFADARRAEASPDHFLLVGARDRAAAVAALDRYLADPAIPLSQWLLSLRAFFTFAAEEAARPKPDRPLPLAEASRARQERFREQVRTLAIRLIPTAAAKQPEARRLSGEAIASLAPDEAKSARLIPGETDGLTREQRIASLPALPREEQDSLLEKHWDLVRGPEVIPVLELLAKNQSSESALLRLHQLAPETARRIVLDDLAAGSVRFATFATNDLPAEPVPQADAYFRRMLPLDDPIALRLMSRFGSANLAGAVRERYLSTEWPCSEEEAFVTHLLRTVPATGEEVLRRALATRVDRGCHHFLLDHLARSLWNPVLEAQSLVSLNDPDPQTVASAAKALSIAGGAATEAALWSRLEKWSSRWRGREIPEEDERLGTALFDAIASARFWLFDEPRRQRLAALCLDKSCRQQWSPLRDGKPQLSLTSNRLDRYVAPSLDALADKIRQYPAGTIFHYCSFGDEEQFERLKTLLAPRTLNVDSAGCPGLRN